MPLKEHYTNDAVNGDRQKAYKQFLQELWMLQGEEKASAAEITTKVYAFEKCIAEVCLRILKFQITRYFENHALYNSC